MQLEPSAEIHHEIATAARVWEDLQARGLELDFELDPQTRAVGITLRDLDGRFVRAVSASEASEIASVTAPGELDRLLQS
jgi:hypothetical protein